MDQHRDRARMWLGFLRKGTGQYDPYLAYLREEVQKGGLTLKDIGTSEEELGKLGQQAKR